MKLLLQGCMFHYRAPSGMPAEEAIREAVRYVAIAPSPSYLLTIGERSIVLEHGETAEDAIRRYRQLEAPCPSPATAGPTASTTDAAGPAAPGAP